MNKKILVITTGFAPENRIGAVRITKIVKYLVRLKYDVTVISPELNEIAALDYSLMNEEIKSIDNPRIAQSNWFKKVFLKRRNVLLKKQTAFNYMNSGHNDSKFSLFKSFIYSHLQFIYNIILNLDWKKNVLVFIKKNYAEGEFDYVFSSYPSLGGIWAANRVRKNKVAAVYVADFRDPINYESNSSWLKIKINTLLQDRILSQADLVTTISKDLFKKFNPKYQHKLNYLPNGYDIDDLDTDFINTSKQLDDTLVFCYVGSLYGGTRKLHSFFKALRELIASGSIEIKHIKLIYAGKEFNELYKQASSFKLEAILEDRGSVSRLESIQIQNSSDIIIVVTWNTEKDQGILTGKLFECFLTQKTILGIVNGTVPNSEFKNIIENVDGGFAFEDASVAFEKDFKELTSFLVEKYKEKKEHGTLKNNYNKNLENFNYKNITNKLVSYFNN